MKNQMKIILFCVFINVTVICLIVIGYCLLHTDNIRMNMKIYDYPSYKNQLITASNVSSKLSLFPDKISRKEVVDINYLKEKNKTYFYLVMDYDKEAYLKESKRLEKVKNILKDTSLNSYIMVLNTNNTYEYVILEEEEDTIIYVYNQLLDWSKTKIKKDHIIDIKDIDKQLIGYNAYVDNDS